jgi:general secretion pathway protein D
MSRWWTLFLTALFCATIAGVISPAYSIEPVGDPATDVESELPPEVEEEIEINIEELEGELGDDVESETEYEEGGDDSDVRVIVEEIGDMKALEEQERKIDARRDAAQADADMKKLLYKAAFEQYRSALVNDPTNVQYQLSMQKALVKHLEELMSQKKYDEVILVSGDVLAENPDNASVEEIWQDAMRLKQGAVTPMGFEADIFDEGTIALEVTAEGLVDEAKELMSKTKYLIAKEKLEEAHKLDLFNVEIDRLLDECHYRMVLARRDRKHALRSERIQGVYKRWDDRPDRPVTREELIDEIPPPISVRKKEILDKLDLIVPDISFTDATLESVLNWVREYADISIWVDPSIWEAPQASLEVEDEYGYGGAYSESPYESGPESGPPGFGGPPGAPAGPGGRYGAAEPSVAADFPASASDPKANDIKLKLTQIPIRELLRYVLIQKNLNYKVEDYAVVIFRPGTTRREEMAIETFRLSVVGVVSGGGVAGGGAGISPGRGGDGLGGASAGSTGAVAGGLGSSPTVALTPSGTNDIKQFLLLSGVDWPPGSNIQPIPSAGMVIVKNTPTNLAMISELINIWNIPPLQVEVEARFASINFDRIYENSFNLSMGAYNIITDSDKITGIDPKREPVAYQAELARTRHLEVNAAPSEIIRTQLVPGRTNALLGIKGILTQPEFEILWNAIDQREYTDILSVPRVTTISGNTAFIRVEEVFEYPGEYELEELDITFSGDGSTTVELPEGFEPFAVVGTDYEEAHVGVTLNVTPTVGADRKTITLDIVPQVTNLVRWLDYGGSSFIPQRKPVFQVQEVETRVYIHDSETVVLGGLITEITSTIHDKVPFFGDIPFVGRLFRGENEDTIKQNLIIFVTARLVTSRGTLLKDQQAMTEKLSADNEGSMHPTMESVGIDAP